MGSYNDLTVLPHLNDGECFFLNPQITELFSLANTCLSSCKNHHVCWLNQFHETAIVFPFRSVESIEILWFSILNPMKPHWNVIQQELKIEDFLHEARLEDLWSSLARGPGVHGDAFGGRYARNMVRVCPWWLNQDNVCTHIYIYTHIYVLYGYKCIPNWLYIYI